MSHPYKLTLPRAIDSEVSAIIQAAKKRGDKSEDSATDIFKKLYTPEAKRIHGWDRVLSESGIGTEQPSVVPLAMVGRAGAGKAIEPIDPEATVYLSSTLQRPDGRPYVISDPSIHKVLRIEGDSMKDAGVEDGDMIVYRVQKEAEKNQLAIVNIKDDGILLKKVHLSDGKVVLLSANSEYPPMLYNPRDIEVQGVFIAKLPKN